MIAIILAAGDGGRLSSSKARRPKCLLSFGGVSLLRRQLELLGELDIERILVVMGYRADLVRAEVERTRCPIPIDLVYNPEYMRGSALSLLYAEMTLQDGAAVIVDGDVLFSRALLGRLVNAPALNCLLVDEKLADSGEEIKVVIRPDGGVCELGKQVGSGGRWIGESIGVYKLSAAANRIFTQTLRQAVESDPDIEYESVIHLALKDFHMGVIDIDGQPWIEIDFPDDLRRAAEQVWPAILEREPAAPESSSVQAKRIEQ